MRLPIDLRHLRANGQKRWLMKESPPLPQPTMLPAFDARVYTRLKNVVVEPIIALPFHVVLCLQWYYTGFT